MKTIVFDGYLHKLYPDGIQVDAKSAAEAIGLLENFPGFRREDNMRHYLTMEDCPCEASFYATTDKKILKTSCMKEAPDTGLVFEGAGGGKATGWLYVVVGAVVMVFAMQIGGAEWGAQIMMAGLGMVMGGIMQLMMPQPPKVTNEADSKSNYLAANKNTVAIGTPIPLLLGRHKVFGHLLSFNVTASNLNVPLNVSNTPGVSEAVGHPQYDVVYDDSWRDSAGS